MNNKKVVYKEKYKKGMAGIKNDKLPLLRHVDKSFIVTDSEIMEAGRYQDGTEYQILKVNLKEGVIK